MVSGISYNTGFKKRLKFEKKKAGFWREFMLYQTLPQKTLFNLEYYSHILMKSAVLREIWSGVVPFFHPP